MMTNGLTADPRVIQDSLEQVRRKAKLESEQVEQIRNLIEVAR